MSRITLNTNSPTLLGHAKHERPALLWVQIGICEHQQALILVEVDILLQIVEDLACVELANLGVRPNSRLDNFLLVENAQI